MFGSKAKWKALCSNGGGMVGDDGESRIRRGRSSVLVCHGRFVLPSRICTPQVQSEAPRLHGGYPANCKLEPQISFDSSQMDLGVLLAIVHGENGETRQNPSAIIGRLSLIRIPILSTKCPVLFSTATTRVDECPFISDIRSNNPHSSYHLGLFPALEGSLDTSTVG